MKDQLEKIVRQMYQSGIRYSEAVAEFQKVFLLTVLNEHNGNQVRTAQALGVHRNTLRRMTQAMGLDPRLLRAMRRSRKPNLNELAALVRKKSVA